MKNLKKGEMKARESLRNTVPNVDAWEHSQLLFLNKAAISVVIGSGMCNTIDGQYRVLDVARTSLMLLKKYDEIRR